jgi:hypothetical protein
MKRNIFQKQDDREITEPVDPIQEPGTNVEASVETPPDKETVSRSGDVLLI